MRLKINLKNPFRKIKDGEWHINFTDWLTDIARTFLQWGLMPILIYAMISQIVGVTKVTDLTEISPIASILIATYLVIRVSLSLLNPPHYCIEKEQPSNSDNLSQVEEKKQ